jgi:acetyl-CoA carboxylase biotin carboxyl carrier protein
MVSVKAPMVGTFYRAPAPGAPPFVAVGQRVAPDSVVCIIEVMKLMSSISAGISGTVKEIRVGDSEPVQFGQVLIVIEPEG